MQAVSVDYNGTQLRKGAGDAIKRHVEAQGSLVPNELTARVELTAVDFSSIVPKPIADVITAKLSGSARLEGFLERSCLWHALWSQADHTNALRCELGG